MKGAVSYASAGEVTPTLTLIGNRIERNCKQLYGNFSTCASALNLDVQNMNSLYFMVSNHIQSSLPGSLISYALDLISLAYRTICCWRIRADYAFVLTRAARRPHCVALCITICSCAIAIVPLSLWKVVSRRRTKRSNYIAITLHRTWRDMRKSFDSVRLSPTLATITCTAMWAVALWRCPVLRRCVCRYIKPRHTMDSIGQFRGL